MNKEKANTFVVLLGMDRICGDFEFVDNKGNSTDSKSHTADKIRQSYIDGGAIVQSEADAKLAAFATAWAMKRMKEKKNLEKQGLTQDEIKERLKKLQGEFRTKYEEENGILNFNASKRENNTNIIFQTKLNKEEKKTHATGAYNALDDFSYVVKQGSRLGTHFMLVLNNFVDLKSCGFKNTSLFRYKLSFQLSADDSRNMFNNKSASTLPDHICKYDDGLDQYSFRPYLHYGVGWEGWFVNEDGSVFNPYKK